MSASWPRMDLSPLASRDFRVVLCVGAVSLLGTEATDVALVVQVKQLTGSTLAVGLLGAAELVPLVVFALRGRLAGAELLSYAVGPSAAQFRVGAVASATTTRFSLISGGVLCVGAVGLVCLALPAFTRYRAPVTTNSS